MLMFTSFTWLKKPQLRAFLYSLIFCLTGGLSQPANAVFDPVNDDTDIFLANPNIPADRPNVLLYVDNTANWNIPFANEKAALVNVVNGLDDSFNVGLMLFPETGAPNDNTDGGYVRFAVRRMTTTNKTVLASIVNTFDRLQDTGNNNTLSLGMVEVYRYFAGLPERASNHKIKTDYRGNNEYRPCSSCAPNRWYNTNNPAQDQAANAFTPPATPPDGLGDYALESNASGAIYNSPIDPTGCASNYLIYISNGTSNENAAALAIAESELSTAGYDTSQIINITPNGQQGNWMDEWAKFLATADVNGATQGTPHVFTYTLEINPQTTGQGPDMTALMKSVANNGKGQYFSASDANGGSEIEAALKSIFSQIQAVNSVFAAVTLPVSVNVRGTNLNQVYIGVFRPDANKKPRWFGNLKMYQLGFDNTTNQLFLADVNGNNTENPTTGFIIPTAQSFWTASSNFWGFRSVNENGAGGSSDLPDGDLVEKGGVAQQLRTTYATDQSGRNLYTCTQGGSIFPDCVDGSQLSATPFVTTNDSINASDLDLNSNPVSGLTAFSSKAITSLTDTFSVSSADTTVIASGTSVAVSLSTAVTPKSASITSLTNAQALPIRTLFNGTLANQAYNTTTSLSASRNGAAKNTATISSQNGVANPNYPNNSTIYLYGFSDAQYNGTWTLTSFAYNTGNNSFSFVISQGTDFANVTATGGTATQTSTTFRATVTSHPFVTNSQVTIVGSYVPANSVFGTSISINGTYNVTVIDSTTFTFTGPASPPIKQSGLDPNTNITASAASPTNTITATAAGHTFAVNDVVRIAGASPAGYNGDYTITSVGNPAASNFTYTITNGSSLATTATGTITAKLLVLDPTVTATGTIDASFAVGVPVTISGASVSAYNVAGPLITSSDLTTTFDFSLSGFVPAVSGLAATATTNAVQTNSSTVTAIIPDHKLTTGNSVVISGDTSGSGFYNGTVTVTVTGPDTITYPIAGNTGACVVNGTPLCPATGTLTAHLATKTAFATVTDHTYLDGNGNVAGSFTAPGTFTVTVKGATPESYNGEFTATVVDATTFKYTYSLVGADTQPLGDATGVPSANLKTTTAVATSIAHGLTTGDAIAISGATPTAFNSASTTATVINGDTFTYTLGSVQGDASGTIIVARIGGAAVAAVNNLINWVRGTDNQEDENSNLSSTDARASIHGDVLHSRPAVVNYNRHGNDNDVYIFYGANDGVFRAVKGGAAQSDVTEPFPGQEAWGFIPPELFGKLKRVRNNSPLISSTDKKPYFMDGSLGIYVNNVTPSDKQLVAADGDKVHIYISTHRGGRFIYALDVSDPLNPELLWKHSNADTGWEELGQTWSVPQVQTLRWSAVNSDHPVLIFGAGYDPTVEDVDSASITAVDSTTGAVTANSITHTRSMGRGIYVVDAFTGDIIWQAGPSGTANALAAAADHPYVGVSNMIYAIPSDVAVLADRNSGVRNRAYVGDTGGNVWRIDMDNTDVNNWTVTHLASIQDTSGLPSDPSGLRKFLFPPDVVQDDGGFDAVLIGSGDREHPFDETIVNRMYMLKDYGIGTTPSNSGMVESDLFDATDNCIQVCTGVAQTAAINDLANADGWFITLGTGEKLVGNAVTLNNVTFFNTNQPTNGFNTDNPTNPINVGGSCGSDLGVARQYAVRYDSAIAVVDQNNDGSLTVADRAEIHPGGGYLPSPVPLTVVINGVVHEGILSGTEVTDPPGTLLGARLRKFWYKEFE